MRMNKFLAHTWVVLCCCITANSHAMPDNHFGQTIQIHTRFHTFLGNPSWLIVIRDIDHNQNIPYVFDITRGDNYWLLFTYGRNYLITASRLQISNYQSRYNSYSKHEINNFCQLESGGRIIRGESMHITISGDLTPYSDTVQCSVSQFPGSDLAIVHSD